MALIPVSYDPTQVALTGAFQNKLLSVRHDPGNDDFVYCRLTAKGSKALLQLCHTTDQKTLRTGRPSYVNALLIASRGVKQAAICGNNSRAVFVEQVNGVPEVDLSEDTEVSIVDRVLRFLYTDDYDDEYEIENGRRNYYSLQSTTTNQEDVTPDNLIDLAQSETSHEAQEGTLSDATPRDLYFTDPLATKLWVNLRVFCIARRYDIKALEILALSRFSRDSQLATKSAEFVRIIELTYCLCRAVDGAVASRENDFAPQEMDAMPREERRNPRDVVASLCARSLNMFLTREDFKAALRRYGDLGCDILSTIRTQGEDGSTPDILERAAILESLGARPTTSEHSGQLVLWQGLTPEQMRTMQGLTRVFTSGPPQHNTRGTTHGHDGSEAGAEAQGQEITRVHALYAEGFSRIEALHAEEMARVTSELNVVRAAKEAAELASLPGRARSLELANNEIASLQLQLAEADAETERLKQREKGLKAQLSRQGKLIDKMHKAAKKPSKEGDDATDPAAAQVDVQGLNVAHDEISNLQLQLAELQEEVAGFRERERGLKAQLSGQGKAIEKLHNAAKKFPREEGE
ncbi:hypothetical protein B0A49_10556 [Cryomyces minteri]|uniref:Uncharacterized protein n=1 Tax=Cryomyces minteri TaxID=331657 RepID=A0A4V5NCY9_9PEZI|nr:hypothetical protein B0A49_10556 [Cryomyces minteri]